MGYGTHNSPNGPQRTELGNTCVTRCLRNGFSSLTVYLEVVSKFLSGTSFGVGSLCKDLKEEFWGEYAMG